MQVLTTARAPLPHRYLACFVDMPREVLCIVTELAAGGTLKRAIACQSQLGRPFSSLSIVKWVEQLSSALSAIHAQLIIHRDIKPANIFLTKEANLKLGDFGLSRRTPHGGAVTGAMDLATTACGTPYYMSPERFQTGVGYSL
jgi:NIMA (never in mitosis gene a)-related kinase